MRQKPCGSVRAKAKIAHELMRGEAFLARSHQVNGEQPSVQRDVRPLHHRASAAGELVSAVAAKKITGLRLAGHAHDIEGTAMRANDAIRPAGTLNPCDC